MDFKNIKNKKELEAFKRKQGGMPASNISLLKEYHKLNKKRNPFIENLLITRKVRSLSGVTIVSVLTKPYNCPGKCLFCPEEKGMPKSYYSSEPAVMRAVACNFDPYLQTKTRLKALKATGHPTDKIELIILGGTWSFLNKKYQSYFITQCFSAANNSKKEETLKKAQKKNETAKQRIVGITVETRPDFIDEKEIIRMRKLGITRVEIGVQSIYNDVLKKNKRGHTIKEIIKATYLLKKAGFKVCYHLMPNLLGSDLKKDEKMFQEIFKNPDFQPDLLKIYPCALLKEAPLYKLWQKKKYQPYTEKQLINLLIKIKKNIPLYCRIQRLVRDIPSYQIIKGPAKISNLRQILQKKVKCSCIRCREVKENYNPKENLFLYTLEYKASKGKEIFLSYENKNRDKLYSLLRLRIPFEKDHFIPALKNAALIREVHTFGKVNPLLEKNYKLSSQHKGLGKKLIRKAEKIAKENNFEKIAVISGIGVRKYYKKLGYELKNTYMIKSLKP
ncbi:MAG: tRNA uridine(34) 5-carboxymethylaminomethyl modification radical SAM/GNAT enzyme Elp3 [Candidatus Pacebacteria bacterium]|nr:tRNA uridine(34) 5-carboxymethylaminomethyl modification radical SAM/GNAT enzyme Elp3 [Candidatus Paceibacterota bacterium]